MNSTPITTRRFVRFLVAAAALAVLLAAAEAALAQSTFDWLAFSGSFQEPNNWLTEGGGSGNPAPPGPRDTAHFIGGDQLVTLASDWTVGTLNVGGFGGPNATYALEFEMNGHVFTGNNLAFGNTVEPTKLILTDGTLFTPAGTGFGPVTNANFTLNLDRATFASTSYTDMATGTASSVYVTVRNGSSYSAGGTQGSYIGNVGAATVTVDGAGSAFALGANSQIGTSGSGAITIQNDGALSTTGVLTLATNANSSGAVTLTNTGSSWEHTDGFITTGGGAAATINVNAGTTMTVVGNSTAAGITLGNHAVLTDAGTLNVGGVGNSGITINSGGALAVNSLGSATVSGGITVNGGGTLTVNALGSVTTKNLTRAGSGVVNVVGGTLTVNGGAFDNGNIPLNLTSPGSLLLWENGASTNYSVSNLNVTGAGNTPATLKVLSGSTVYTTGPATIAGITGTATVLVDGAGSILSVPSVAVGAGYTGYLTVQNGGHFQGGTTAYLGSIQGASGVVSVTGAGSRSDFGDLYIGSLGYGTLNVTAGGVVSSAQATIAQGQYLSSVTIAGTASTWSTTNGLYIGGGSSSVGGNGSLIITDGGAVSVTGETKIWNNGALTINGGSLTTGSLTRLGTLNLQNGTLAIDGSAGPGILNNGTSPTDLVVQGNAANALATLQLTNAATTSNINTLKVGDSRQGTLVLSGGSHFSALGVSMATTPSGTGTITLTGPNTSLTTVGSITVGVASAGASTLSIGLGAAVTAGNVLVLNNSGTVNLNGGTLTMAGLIPNGGSFNWTSGTVAYTAVTFLDAPQVATLLGSGGTLTAGRTLAGTSTYALNGAMTVAGGQLTGSQLQVSAGALLNLTGGSVSPTSGILNSGLIAVSGGTITAPAITNSGEIQLAGLVASIGASGTTLTNTGRLDGTGRINSNLVNSFNGLIAVDTGQRLVFGGANNTNNSNGTISLTGGTVEFTAPLTNAAGGFISGRGTLRGNSANFTTVDPLNPAVDYGLKNSGTVAFSGGFSDVFGKVNNLGSPTGGGKIINAGAGTVTFHDDVVHNGQEIRTVSGSRTVFFGAVSGAGPYTGTGTVEFDGDLRPGNSPAVVGFAGDLDLGYGATLHIEIGGATPAAQYDQVHVAGQLGLAGALDAVLYNGFEPVVGNSFDILDWNSLTGTFSSVILPTLAAGRAWDTSQLYTTGMIAVVATAGLLGDFNGNGIVDAADYVVWRKGLGTVYTPADYNIWRTHFGQTAAAAATANTAGIAAMTAVPEPGSAALLFTGGCWMLTRTRGRKRTRY